VHPWILASVFVEVETWHKVKLAKLNPDNLIILEFS